MGDIDYNTCVMQDKYNGFPSAAANSNHDPFATAASALDWLYMLRREMLKMDTSVMTLAERREREQALAKFAKAEKSLLAEL
jgi:hypothetical protein